MANTTKKRTKSDALKKSILQQAVEGKLTGADTSKWVETTLGEVCQLFDKPKITNGRYVRLDTHFLRGRAKVTYDDFGRFTTAGSLQILVDGENSGEVFKVPVDGYLGSTFKSLEVDRSCTEEYALLLISSQRDNLKNNKRGSAIPHLDKKLFRETPVSLPPLAEQQAIVAKLEKILPLVERYAELERERDDLDVKLQPQLRRSILNSAITGKLTNEDTSGWKETKLGDLPLVMGQSPDGNSISESAQGIEFHQGKIHFTDRVISKSNVTSTKPAKIAPENSILLCVRAPVGKINFTDRKLCIGRGLASISGTSAVSVVFLYYLLLTLESYFNEKATGSTFVAITKKIVEETPINLPPLHTQARIVAKVDQLFAQLDRLETKL